MSIKTVKYLLFIALIVLAIVFYFVFSGKLILPQSFHLGPLTIRYYGIVMALAVAAGFYYAIKRSGAIGISPDKAEDFLFWLIVGGFVGARLYHVLSSAGYYIQYPVDIIKVWNGGLSIYGAVIGGIIALLIARKIFNFQFAIFNLLDWLVPSVVLGQVIGRFGNLFNYEAFGYPTGLPWKMFVPAPFRPEGFLQAQFFHPWFLYEAFGNAVILLILIKVKNRKRRFEGEVVFLYLLLYNLLRFSLEFLRIDSTFIGGFRLNAIVSLVLAAVGAAGLLYARNKHVQAP